MKKTSDLYYERDREGRITGIRSIQRFPVRFPRFRPGLVMCALAGLGLTVAANLILHMPGIVFLIAWIASTVIIRRRGRFF